jgi:Tat protein translocase TatB subunit
MLNIGPQELLLIILVALIVVGPKKLPQLSRQIGKGLQEFKKVQDDVKDMVKFDLEPEPETPTRAPASPTAPGANAGPAGVHRTSHPRTTEPAPVDEVVSSSGAQGLDEEARGPDGSASDTVALTDEPPAVEQAE